MKITEQTREFEKVDITYYTDPLCCWSWAFEPQWARLRQEFKGQIHWKYRMAGIIPDWKNYAEQCSCMFTPNLMSQTWQKAQQSSGMPFTELLWDNNPPESSFPACIAVKCAELQNPLAGEMYLRMMREAAMMHGENISDERVFIGIAMKLALRAPSVFDLKLFEQALLNHTGLRLFRVDLEKVSSNNIVSFPTLVFSRPGQSSIRVEGYVSYEKLLQTMKEIAPDICPQYDARKKAQEMFSWNLTERECMELSLK